MALWRTSGWRTSARSAPRAPTPSPWSSEWSSSRPCSPCCRRWRDLLLRAPRPRPRAGASSSPSTTSSPATVPTSRSSAVSPGTYSFPSGPRGRHDRALVRHRRAARRRPVALPWRDPGVGGGCRARAAVGVLPGLPGHALHHRRGGRAAARGVALGCRPRSRPGRRGSPRPPPPADADADTDVRRRHRGRSADDHRRRRRPREQVARRRPRRAAHASWPTRASTPALVRGPEEQEGAGRGAARRSTRAPTSCSCGAATAWCSAASTPCAGPGRRRSRSSRPARPTCSPPTSASPTTSTRPCEIGLHGRRRPLDVGVHQRRALRGDGRRRASTP